MYDPTIGRFLSEDPIGFAGGTDNLSEYVGNAPTMYVDPSGFKAFLAQRVINGRRILPFDHTVAHQFAYTTNEYGGLRHTYSWGNHIGQPNDTADHWVMDAPEDMQAAREAIELRDKADWETYNKSSWVRESKLNRYSHFMGDDDAAVAQAFAELHNAGANSPSAHGWRPTCSCIHESKHLLERAAELRRDGNVTTQ